MSRIERRIAVVLFVLAFGIWGAVGLRTLSLWRQPLGLALQLPTYTPTPRATALPPHNTSVAEVATARPTSTRIPGLPVVYNTPIVENANRTTLCGGPQTMTILAIGSDTRASGYLYGLADVIRLVRVDFATPRITVLEFPRDLWVEIPNIKKKYNLTNEKLNQAYLYGNKGMGYYDGPGEGPELLARTLDLNFGARPDHYIAANMQTFVKLVDAVGGIDVYLPETVDGRAADQPTRYDLVFKEGTHHLKGSQALMLARIRISGVFHRADQQNHVLCGLRDALLSPANVSRLPQIIDVFDGAVQTDLTPEQLSQLACLAPFIPRENIVFASFPEELLTGGRVYDKVFDKEVFIWNADFDLLRLYVSAFNTGQWPATSMAAPALPGNTSPQIPASFSCP